MELPAYPRAVLFDLDGTVLDNSSIIVDAYYTGMIKLGYDPKPREFIKSLLGKSTFTIGRALGLQEDQLPFIDQHFFEFFGQQAMDPTHVPVVYPGVENLLAFFHKYNIPIGICTSNRALYAKSLMNKANLSNFITTFVGEEDVNEKKPSPEPLFLTLNRLGFTKDQTKDNSLWYIGDSSSDIEAASKAGMLSFAVPDEEKLISVQVLNPDYVFTSMVDLFSFIKPIFS